MAEALKPCPFCGGTSFVGSLNGGLCMDHEDDGAPLGIVAEMYCENCGCRLQCKVLPEDAHEVDADEMLWKKWNRRAERTCRIDMPVIDWETGETDYRCSACGFSADPQDWAETYDYCPRCGAKVVES